MHTVFKKRTNSGVVLRRTLVITSSCVCLFEKWTRNAGFSANSAEQGPLNHCAAQHRYATEIPVDAATYATDALRNRHSDGEWHRVREAAPAAHVRALHAHGHWHTLLTPHYHRRHRHCTGHTCITHTHTHTHTHTLSLSLSLRGLPPPPTHRHCVCRIFSIAT